MSVPASSRVARPDGAEPLGWGCFAAVVPAAGALFAFTVGVCCQPQWDLNLLAALLVSPFVVGLAALGLYRALDRFFPVRGAGRDREADWGNASRPRTCASTPGPCIPGPSILPASATRRN